MIYVIIWGKKGERLTVIEVQVETVIGPALAGWLRMCSEVYGVWVRTGRQTGTVLIDVQMSAGAWWMHSTGVIGRQVS